MEQIRLVVGHLLTLVGLLNRYRRQQHKCSQHQAPKRPAGPDVNWMVVHGGILGLNYVFAARQVSLFLRRIDHLRLV